MTQKAEDRLIRIEEVMEIIGIKKSTVWLWAKEKSDFPQPIKLSPRVTVWSEKEVNEYAAAMREKCRS